MHYDMHSYESLLPKSNGIKERSTHTENKGKVPVTNSRARSCIFITVEVQYSGPLTPKLISSTPNNLLTTLLYFTDI